VGRFALLFELLQRIGDLSAADAQSLRQIAHELKAKGHTDPDWAGMQCDGGHASFGPNAGADLAKAQSRPLILSGSIATARQALDDLEAVVREL